MVSRCPVSRCQVSRFQSPRLIQGGGAQRGTYYIHALRIGQNFELKSTILKGKTELLNRQCLLLKKLPARLI